MNLHIPEAAIFLLVGLGIILIILCGIIALTNRIGFRLGKADTPKLKVQFAIAVLQILLGVVTVFVVKAIQDEPAIALGAGLGMVLFSGLFLTKWILKCGWKQLLRVWAVAAGIQLVLVPVCSSVMLVGFIMLIYKLYPPQF